MGQLVNLKKLSLSTETLTGSFPSTFGLMSNLTQLIILPTQSNNFVRNFTGDIPKSFWNLSRLDVLRLETTSLRRFETLEGASLPSLTLLSFHKSMRFESNLNAVVKSATNLQFIDISNTAIEFDGETLEDLSDLSSVNLARSKASWIITSQFWRTHPHLRYFSVESNPHVRGIIGRGIGSMRFLSYLNFDSVSLWGTIPDTIADCPLQTLIISKTNLNGPIPSTIGNLNRTLSVLHISGLVSAPSEIPRGIGALHKLRSLVLSSNNLRGTLPPELSQATSLENLVIDNNGLVGDLPEIRGKRKIQIDVHNNQLNGTIPRSIAARASSLILSYNRFSGEIDKGLLATGNIDEVSLSHNFFSGPLPLFHPTNMPHSIDLGFNNFEGTFPAQYCNITNVDLSHNILNGTVDVFSYPNCSKIRVLNIGHNRFTGKFPDVEQFSMLMTLSAANNKFTGNLPRLPSSMSTLDLKGNDFEGRNAMSWGQSAAVQGLNYLDISGNGMILPLSYEELIGPNLQYLSVAYNTLELPDVTAASYFPALTGLDISNTRQVGTFAFSKFPNLALLKLNDNFYEGPIDFFYLKSVTQLDISRNNFQFEISRLTSLPLLTTFNAYRNRIYGSLVLQDLPNLQTINLASNSLDIDPDLASIGFMFTSILQSLNISRNRQIPLIKHLETSATGLARGSASAPSVISPGSVICYELLFFNLTGRTFIYDEDLFDYTQCDCNHENFGFPPLNCHPCPSAGTSACGGSKVVISSGHFASQIYETVALPPPPPTFAPWSLPGEPTDLSPPTDGPAPATPTAPRYKQLMRLNTESCLYTTAQTLSGRSNCLGIRITAEDLARPNVSVSEMLKTQCSTGSDGRLCSHCQCDSGGVDGCWFSSGPTCSKCRRVFPLSTSIPLAVSGAVIALAILTLTMACVLRRKRRQSLKRLDKLPLMKRVFYRFIHLTSLGNVSILVTFLQMLLEFTQWDAYAKLKVFGVLNGGVDGLGLRCLFPLLSDPMWALLLQLSLPFLVIAALAISVSLGGWVAHILESREGRARKLPLPNAFDSEADAYDNVDATKPILSTDDGEVEIEYPTLALLTSLSITVVKFFYFGTALAAHEYLFSSSSASGLKYVQSKPWMLHSESWPLVLASLPALLIFDFVIPAVFIFICWKFRHSFKWTSVQVYFGSLFETYDPRCFWWEIVNTLRKLSIALVMRAFTSNDALQSTLVVTILSLTQLAQLTLNPWRRKTENFADGGASMLLITALIYTRPTNFQHTPGVLWYIFALAVGYALASGLVIIWHAVTETTNYEKCIDAIRPRLHIQNDDDASSLAPLDATSESEPTWQELN